MDQHSARAASSTTATTATTSPLPRRYRIALAALCLAGGVVLGLLAFTTPSTPSTTVTLGAFLALGTGLGLAAFRALEHSLE